MDDQKLNLKGSPSRDAFKQWHKTLFPWLYACDADFILVNKNPPGIVAVLDYKTQKDHVTFSEVLAYNDFVIRGIPVYIVVGCEPFQQLEIYLYLGGNSQPEPPQVRLELIASTNTRLEFALWESKIRQEWQYANQ